MTLLSVSSKFAPRNKGRVFNLLVEHSCANRIATSLCIGGRPQTWRSRRGGR